MVINNAFGLDFDLNLSRVGENNLYFSNSSRTASTPSSAVLQFATEDNTDFYPQLNLSTRNDNYASSPIAGTQMLKFQKAENMQDAINYAKQKLHIKNFDMHGDLELANWVNAGLTEIHNKTNGKALMPGNVVKGTEKKPDVEAYYNWESDTISIVTDNKKEMLKRLATKLYLQPEDNQRTLANWYKKALRNDFSQIDIIDPKLQKRIADDLTAFRKNPNKYDFTECKKLYNELSMLTEPGNILKQTPIKLIEELYTNPKYKNILESNEFHSLAAIKKMDKNTQVKEFYNIVAKLKAKGLKVYIDPEKSPFNNPFYEIYHEHGHLMHSQKISYSELRNQKNAFKTDNYKQSVAEQVSTYAKSEPMEFVAEVYAGLMNGAKYSTDVMSLYKSYNGPLY